MNEIIILGCGPSSGVPILGCKCEVCKSDNPKNKRTRSSILIKYERKQLLVDFGPDIRNQLLLEDIDHLDAAILTHDHADHLNGIDDLKIFAFRHKNPLDLYSDESTIKTIMGRFAYMFDSPDANDYWGAVRLNAKTLEIHKKTDIAGIPVIFFWQNHGRIDSLGIRINNFVYSNDLVRFYEDSEPYLYDIESWVVDCIGPKTTYGHAGLDSVLEWNDKYKPKKMFLTNLGHTFDYDKLSKELPDNIKLCYDGLKISI